MIKKNFLAIHTRYNDVQIAAYKNSELVELICEESKKISKNFFNTLENLLKNCDINFEQLEFIAAHVGPAPYTSLRVVLASINGCSFVKPIPLVGVNGLDAILKSNKLDNSVTVAILNAYGSQVYFGISDGVSEQNILGSAPIEQFLTDISLNYKNKKIKFIGNGVTIYKEMINKFLPDSDIDESIEIATIESVSNMALEAFQMQDIKTFELMPVYLK